MTTGSCFELSISFPTVSFDVTLLKPELCAFHLKELMSTCLCMKIELHILMYYYCRH